MSRDRGAKELWRSDALRPGLLLVLSAPSGAGKTTLARVLLDAEPSVRLSVSTTTRPPRPLEEEGRDYHFVDVPSFRRMVEAGAFAEWAEVHGFQYGTSRAVVEQALSAPGSLTLFDIDVQGGEALKRQYPGAVTVFILPPSPEVLAERLRSRKTESREAIERRLAAARSEIARGLAEYDYLVVNRKVEDSCAELQAIVRAERVRIARFSKELRDALTAW
jgi:guanylate kinase